MSMAGISLNKNTTISGNLSCTGDITSNTLSCIGNITSSNDLNVNSTINYTTAQPVVITQPPHQSDDGNLPSPSIFTPHWGRRVIPMPTLLQYGD